MYRLPSASPLPPSELPHNRIHQPRGRHRFGSQRRTCPIDAIRAAREALSCEHLTDPRRRGQREALRVLVSTRASADPRHQPPQGAHRVRTGGAASRAARHDQRQPDHLLRVVAAAAVSRPRAPHHGPGASFHSATDPGTTAGGQRSGSGDRTASGSDAAAAACFDRGETDQRRAGADQLVASRPVPFRGGVRRIRLRVTDTGVLGTDHPPSPEPRRRSTTQPGTTHHCAGQGPPRTHRPTSTAESPKAKVSEKPSDA